MAVDIFVKFIVGGVALEGESTDKKHAKETQALTLTWGYAQHPLPEGTRGTSKAEFLEMRFTKRFDSTSPTLYTILTAGTKIPKVVITLRKSAGQEPVEFGTFTLGNVIVSSIEGTAGTDDAPLETVGLTYSSVLWRAATPKLTLDKAPEKGWNRIQNKPIGPGSIPDQ